jgi:hypothetical protein
MNESDFQKRYSAAPQRIKDFLISEELNETTKNIVVLTKLDINQTTELTEMISDVLVGQISPVDFSHEIESNLKISHSQARIIIELAKKKIFGQFSKELEEYKSQFLKQKILQGKEMEEGKIPSSTSASVKDSMNKKATEDKKQTPAEPIIPEYSFPEPSKVMVEKPVSKMEGLKKVVTPKVSSEQQEKIREKLLAAMQKKNNQPKIVEEMKKIFLKPKAPKETKEKKTPGRIKIGELTSSKILSGEGKKFKDEEVFKKTEKEKPYIIGAKLKEEKEKKEETDISEEPIPYKKYQKKNPFGKA